LECQQVEWPGHDALSDLEALDVWSNQITNDGVLALCQLLTSLHKVWLQDNPQIGWQAAQALCDYASQQPQLEYVCLSKQFDGCAEETWNIILP
jgi:Ran GTPase-activating protein (RanGAP) involved in mRNA processing and transport